MITASARDKWALGVSLGVHGMAAAVLAWTSRPVAWSWEATGEEKAQEVTLWVEARAAERTPHDNGVFTEPSVAELPPPTEEPAPETLEKEADNAPEAAPAPPAEPSPAPPELSEPTAPEPAVPKEMPSTTVVTNDGMKVATPPTSQKAATSPPRVRSAPRPTKPAVSPRAESRSTRERASAREAGATTAGGSANQAGRTAGGGDGKPSKGSVSARPWRTPAPPYPAEAKSRGWQGVVSLRVRVGANGLPQAVEIVRSSGHAVLDEQARRTVASQWKFRPAEIGGQPTASTVTVPVRFALRR